MACFRVACCNLHTRAVFTFKGRFSGERGLSSCAGWFSSYGCSGRELVGINGTHVQTGCPFCNAAAALKHSKHWSREGGHPLAFLNPSADCWGREGRCNSFVSSCLMPVGSYFWHKREWIMIAMLCECHCQVSWRLRYHRSCSKLLSQHCSILYHLHCCRCSSWRISRSAGN